MKRRAFFSALAALLGAAVVPALRAEPRFEHRISPPKDLTYKHVHYNAFGDRSIWIVQEPDTLGVRIPPKGVGYFVAVVDDSGGIQWMAQAVAKGLP